MPSIPYGGLIGMLPTPDATFSPGLGLPHTHFPSLPSLYPMVDCLSHSPINIPESIIPPCLHHMLAKLCHSTNAELCLPLCPWAGSLSGQTTRQLHWLALLKIYSPFLNQAIRVIVKTFTCPFSVFFPIPYCLSFLYKLSPLVLHL